MENTSYNDGIELLVQQLKEHIANGRKATKNPIIIKVLTDAYENVSDLHHNYKKYADMLSKGLICKKCAHRKKQEALKQIFLWAKITKNAINYPEMFENDIK